MCKTKNFFFSRTTKNAQHSKSDNDNETEKSSSWFISNNKKPFPVVKFSFISLFCSTREMKKREKKFFLRKPKNFFSLSTCQGFFHQSFGGLKRLPCLSFIKKKCIASLTDFVCNGRYNIALCLIHAHKHQISRIGIIKIFFSLQHTRDTKIFR